MRILILSDIHAEVWREAPREAQSLLSATHPDLSKSMPDVVILAGDIDVGDRAVIWADENFPGLPVIYVHGNHEAYGDKIDTLKVKLADSCAATGHVHFLDRSELVIGGIRFLGATLWTDFQLLGADSAEQAMHCAAAEMNDYRKIRIAKAGFRKIRPLDAALWHSEDRRWLQERLEQPFDGSTIVVTHMAPSLRSVPSGTRANYFQRPLRLTWKSWSPRQACGYTAMSMTRWTTCWVRQEWSATLWVTPKGARMGSGL